MPSKKKASILNRDNYQTGGPAEEQSPSDAALDEQVAMYQQLSNAAKTPDEQKQVNDSFGEMLPAILKRIQGGAGEELFPRGGLGDALTVESPDPKELRMGQAVGGSLMMPPERKGYSAAGKVIGVVGKALKEAGESGERVLDFLSESQDEIEDFVVNTLKDKRSIIEIIEEDGVKGVNKIDEALLFEHLTKKEREEIATYGATKDQMKADQEIIAQEVADTGREMEAPNFTDAELATINKNVRERKQEGSLMVPPEMESDMPVDTYPNIPPEEMDEAMASQLPDAEMEDKYLDFVLDESLDDEEQSYLMNALEADPKLSQIFDKVVTTASEFTGAGEVEGPGTGVSDSIPARLSDGEFVFTKKATDQMGADNLQMMMDDAERAFDGGQMRESAETGGLLLYNQEDDNPLAYEKIAQDEIKKNMLRSNRAPSLMAG